MNNTSIKIRKAQPADVLAITSLFRNAIEQVNKKDYSAEHIRVWASGADDIEKWKNRIDAHYFIIAEIDQTVVGFAYITRGNYFDGLFVHPSTKGRGIATQLLKHIEEKIAANGFHTIDSDVSITALPFFTKHGYRILSKQQKPYQGLYFENYIVQKNTLK